MAFGYYKVLTLGTTALSLGGALTDWPLTISLGGNVQGADANLKSVGNGGHVTSTSGFDLRPYDTTGVTALDYELVYYDPTTGSLEMHVRVPTLSATDMAIRLYYNDASKTSDGSVPTTWATSYKGIYHQEDSTNWKDSSQSAHSAGTGHASPINIAGEFHNAQKNNTTGADEYVDTGYQLNAVSTGDLTISMWCSHTNAYNGGVREQTIEACSGDTSQELYGFLNYDGPQMFIGCRGGTGANYLNISPSTAALWPQNTPVHYVYRILSGTSNFYVNAVSQATNSSLINAPGQNLNMGGDPSFGRNHHGWIDEIRYSNAGLSTDWLKADYNSQKPSATFISWGSEQSVGGGAAPFGQSNWPNPQPWLMSPVNRTHLDNHVRFLGQDQFFGGPGQPPTHDPLPNPIGRARFQPDFYNNLLGTLYAPNNAPPFYLTDWPNPRTWRTQDLTWLQEMPFLLNDYFSQTSMGGQYLPTTLRGPYSPGWSSQDFYGNLLPGLLSSVVYNPFYQTSWPNPGTWRTQDLTWLQNTKTLLNDYFGQTNQGKSHQDLPPVGRYSPAVQSQDFYNNLLGTLLVLRQNPFYQSDWPNPKGYGRLEGTWLQSPNWNLQNWFSAFTFAGGVTVVPTRPPFSPAFRSQEFYNNLLPGLLQTTPSIPFYMTDWPNPHGPVTRIIPEFYNNVLAFLNAYSAYPFGQTNWPNPVLPPRVQPTVTQTPLFTTLYAAYPFNQPNWANPGKPRQTQPVAPTSQPITLRGVVSRFIGLLMLGVGH